MVLSLSVEVHFFQFTFPTFSGQDHAARSIAVILPYEASRDRSREECGFLPMVKQARRKLYSHHFFWACVSCPCRVRGNVSDITIFTTTPERKVSTPITPIAHGTPNRSASTPASSAPIA